MMDDVSEQENNIEKRVSVRFQIIAIMVSIACLFLVYQRRLSQFNAVDDIPQLQGYNPESLATFGDFYSPIVTGLVIEQYEVFDVSNNNFIIDGTLWFIVDPTVTDTQTLSKFHFEQGTLLSVAPPQTTVIDDKLLVQYRIRLQFFGSLVYTYFPLDEHRIALTLTNKVLTPQEALFVSESRYFSINASVKTFGWDIEDQYVLCGYKTYYLDNAKTRDTDRNEDPYVEFVVDFKRASYRYVISIIFPMLTFFYLSLFAFSMGDSSGFFMTTGSLTALVSFRFIIDRLSPSVGYFMLSDYLFFTFLAAIFTAFIFLVLDALSPGITLFFRKVLLLLLHLAVVLLNIYFVL